MTPAVQLLSDFRTGFLTTRISQTSTGSFLWQHTPGPNRDQPFPTMPQAFINVLSRATNPALAWLAPLSATPSELLWETDGQYSLAAALEADTHTDQQIETIGAQLGTQLRQFHDLTRGQSPEEHQNTYPHRHPGLTRLHTWLATGRGPRAASAFHYRLRSQLGSRRWDHLNQLTHHMLNPGSNDPTRALHGWFSLGSIVVSEEPGTTACSILSGPDTCWGRPEIDIACFVGELIEYRLATQRKGITWPILDRLQHAFLTHYGTGADADTQTIAAGSLLRVATHAHDYASYVGWSDQLHSYVPMLTELLDDEHTILLPP
jgi:hypothetical protein